jgi:hypothetical protein
MTDHQILSSLHLLGTNLISPEYVTLINSGIPATI